MLMGESYDARLEMSDWSKAGFDDTDWSKVKVIADPGIARVAQYGPPVRRIQEIKAEKVGKDASGWVVTGGGIYDMHQNMVGRVRLKMRGPRGAIFRSAQKSSCWR